LLAYLRDSAQWCKIHGNRLFIFGRDFSGKQRRVKYRVIGVIDTRQETP
jgi:hypothetical protein